MRTDVEFKTQDRVTLRAWHYLPDRRSGKVPTIVMAHGFSAVKEMYLDKFAEVFATAGLGALVFDNRNFGASGGEPRQEIDPWEQVRDYRDAITFAETLPETDADRIGIWGSSYSGGHVLVVGAIDRVLSEFGSTSRSWINHTRRFTGREQHCRHNCRFLFNDGCARRKLDTLLIQCVVPSQHVLINAVNKRAVQIKKKGGLRLHHDCELYKVPLISGHNNARRLIRADFWAGLHRMFDDDRRNRYAGKPPGMIPVVAEDPLAPSALPTSDSWSWFTETGRTRAPSWRNEVTLRSVEMFTEYEPGSYISFVSPTPLLLVVALGDHLTVVDEALAAYERALEPKKLVMLSGGHFDAYVKDFEFASTPARDWFITHLKNR